ncbi:MAG: LysR family transcriptional regulator [Gammaproteobacteria bacterium]
MNLLSAMIAFRHVAETASFSAGGARVGRTKTAMSKLVAELERHLGVRLLQRTTRRVTLTDAGRNYLSRCTQILTDLDELHGEMRDAQAALRGTLRITAPQAFGERHLVPALAAFARREPEVKLELQLTDRFVDLVEERFDLAVRIGELTDSSLVARRLSDMRIVLCASPDCLARHGSPATPDALARLPCIIDSNLRTPRQWGFMQEGRRITVPVDGAFVVNSLGAVLQLAQAGHGFALLPDFVVRAELRAGTLVPLLAHALPPPLGIHAVFPHRRYVTRRLTVLVDHLAAAFARPRG